MTKTANIPDSFRTALPAVLFVAAIFFFNFLTRVALAPLMPVIQDDLGFTHAGAGQLFFALAVGNGAGLFLNAFISRATDHRRTVGLSAVMVGVFALVTPLADSYAMLLAALLALGMAVGVYLPSGIAAVTSLVRREDWGKTMAAHELAPNLSYVVAPLMAEALLLFFGWRAPLVVLGVAQIAIGLIFLRCGKGGEFPGVVPGPAQMLAIVRRPVFWLLILLFSMAVGVSIGPYSMLPLYLTDAHGYTREEANRLLAASRVTACFVPFFAGWITDRWGARPAILLYLLLCGSALVALGFASGAPLVALVVLQPIFSVLLFAPGFTVLARVFEAKERSVAVALMGPINAVIGVGAVPTFLGHMGDAGLFHLGFLSLGCILLATILFLPVLPSGQSE